MRRVIRNLNINTALNKSEQQRENGKNALKRLKKMQNGKNKGKSNKKFACPINKRALLLLPLFFSLCNFLSPFRAIFSVFSLLFAFVQSSVNVEITYHRANFVWS